MSKGGERASSVALPQPAANGAFAVVGRSWMVGVMTGSDCAGLCRSGLGVGQVAQTERSGVRRFCGVVCVGLVMSKGGKRASMVALPQPAANGSLCGCGSIAGSSGWLRKRSEAESSAYEGSFPLNSAYRLSGMNA